MKMKDIVSWLTTHSEGRCSVTELVLALHAEGIHLSSIAAASAMYTLVIGEPDETHVWVDIRITKPVFPKA